MLMSLDLKPKALSFSSLPESMTNRVERERNRHKTTSECRMLQPLSSHSTHSAVPSRSGASCSTNSDAARARAGGPGWPRAPVSQ